MKELAEILLAFVLNRFPTKRSKVVILKATSLVRRIGTKRQKMQYYSVNTQLKSTLIKLFRDEMPWVKVFRAFQID